MSMISIKLDDGTGEVFDEALKNTLMDTGDLTVITKDDGTKDGNACVMITFTVVHPKTKEVMKAQAVTTAKCFAMAGAAVKGKYNLP